MSPRGDRRVVGLVPAAGLARRLSPLPCSKELLPVGFYETTPGDASSLRPKPVCLYLLEQMRAAGAEQVFLVVDRHKWDIPVALCDVEHLGLGLGYIVVADSPGPVVSIQHAAPFVEDRMVLFGFPDIISHPKSVFARLLERQRESGADVVLALLPASEPSNTDVVDAAPDGTVRQILIKPTETSLRLAWIGAVWTPRFTAFLGSWQPAALQGTGRLDVGMLMRNALAEGYHVNSVTFSDGSFVDIGTPADLVRAVHRFTLTADARAAPGNQTDALSTPAES